MSFSLHYPSAPFHLASYEREADQDIDNIALPVFYSRIHFYPKTKALLVYQKEFPF